MEPTNNISVTASLDASPFQSHMSESTNPFQRVSNAKETAVEPGSKTGKRPRIIKPVYSVRLF